MQSIDQDGFDDMLAKAEGLVLVDFWADWCGPCKTLAPILEKVETTYGDRVTFVKVNSDANRELAGAFGVKSLPTVLILAPRAQGQGADVVGHAIGVKPAAHFEQLLDKALLPSSSGVFGWLKAKLGGTASE